MGVKDTQGSFEIGAAAAERINRITSIRISEQKGRRLLLGAGLVGIFSALGLTKCASEIGSEVNSNRTSRNFDSTVMTVSDEGILAGAAGLVLGAAGGIASYFGYKARAKAKKKSNKNIYFFDGSYDLRCLQYMKFDERLAIVAEENNISKERSEPILKGFETQEFRREALRKANEAEGVKRREQLHADRHTPFYPPRSKEDPPSHEPD